MPIKCAIPEFVSAPPILYQLQDIVAGVKLIVSTVIPTGSKENTVKLQNTNKNKITEKAIQLSPVHDSFSQDHLLLS